MNDATNLIVVTLASQESAQEWTHLDGVVDVVTFKRASSSGRRFGSRVLGIGLDGLLAALLALRRPGHYVYLATNPWIGVWLRLLSRQRLIVTGIYSSPGRRSWSLLRWLLGSTPVITLADVEADNWRGAGGVAHTVAYGNTFPYQLVPENRPEIVRIFVGGTSDRDGKLIDRLAAEVLDSGLEIELLVALGGPKGETWRQQAVVRRYGRIGQVEFGRLIGESDISYLPLLPGNRAAGHMILVGSLQVGTPVVVSGGSGMSGYIDGRFVRSISSDGPVLQPILSALATNPRRQETHDYWSRRYSRRAYFARLGSAIAHFEASGRL